MNDQEWANDEIEPLSYDGPQPLGEIPSYVLLHHAIARSAHGLSATAHKLAIMAMALLPLDFSCLTATFTLPQFFEALGLTDGGKNYALVKNAVKECSYSTIMIDIGTDANGKTLWRKFHWFQECSYNADTGVVSMQFSPDLASYLVSTSCPEIS